MAGGSNVELSHSHTMKMGNTETDNLLNLAHIAEGQNKLSANSNEYGWTKVNKNMAAKRPAPSTLDHQSKRPVTNNRFEMLEAISFNGIIENDEGANKKPLDGATPTINPVALTKFCPPIFIEGANINIKELIEKLKAINIVDFKIKNVNKTKTKLYVKNPLDHAMLMEKFKKDNVSSYSFTPKQDRQQMLILRGLTHNTNIDDVAAALDELAPDMVYSIKPFVTKFSLNNNVATGLFMVALNPGYNITDIGKKVKNIEMQSIKWELPHATNKIIQCKRCQKWGHIAKNCNREYRCVKCDKNHNPGECQLLRDDDTKPYCINCKKWGHPANYTGCEAYTYFKQLRDKKNGTQLKKNPMGSGNYLVNKNVSYASILKNNTEKQTNTKAWRPKIIDDFMKAVEEILKPKDNLEDRIINFLQNINQLSNEERRRQYLSLFKEVVVQYGDI